MIWLNFYHVLPNTLREIDFFLNYCYSLLFVIKNTGGVLKIKTYGNTKCR